MGYYIINERVIYVVDAMNSIKMITMTLLIRQRFLEQEFVLTWSSDDVHFRI